MAGYAPNRGPLGKRLIARLCLRGWTRQELALALASGLRGRDKGARMLRLLDATHAGEPDNDWLNELLEGLEGRPVPGVGPRLTWSETGFDEDAIVSWLGWLSNRRRGDEALLLHA